MERKAEIRRLKKDLSKLVQQQRKLMDIARFGGRDAAEAARYEHLQNQIQQLIHQLADLEQCSNHR